MVELVVAEYADVELVTTEPSYRRVDVLMDGGMLRKRTVRQLQEGDHVLSRAPHGFWEIHPIIRKTVV